MKRFLALLLLATLLLTAAGCSSADGDGAEIVEPGDNAAAADEGESTEAPAAGTRENPLPLGTTAKVGDWEITVASVNLLANDAVAQANQFNSPPVAGSQYVMAALTAKYVGADSGTFWTDMSAKFIGSAGNTFDQGGSSYAVVPTPITDTGETFPGASVSGNLVFEVPSDQVEGGALILEESISFDDTRTFFAVK